MKFKHALNNELVDYIESTILPQYDKNESGHGRSHINYVIERSFKFAEQVVSSNVIDMNMVYVIAVYHDISHHIDPKNHEIISASMMLRDKELKKWFDEKSLLIIHDAIAEHRASRDDEPSTIYGKIVSSADRSTNVESILRRAYTYRKNLNPTIGMCEAMEDAYIHICNKFGENGYAVEKMYFKDEAYEDFLHQVRLLTENKNAFRKLFFEVNGLTKSSLRDKIAEYSPWNDQEIADKTAMLEFMDTFDDVVTRDNKFGHFTASAFVVNDHRTHAIMLHHNIMGDWIYPGGHADGEYDLVSVAMREVEEETGLKVEPMFGDEIFAIQAAPVKGHVKNGKYIPAHIHYDVLFMFKARNEDMDKIRVLASENTSVEWWELCDTFTRDDVVDWAQPVNRKIVQKMDY